ncbi:MAG: response regulator transcription factor [Pseudomonadota bacterium]
MPTKQSARKVLIADDHWVVRESLKQVATSLDGVLETIEAGSFHEALQILEQDPDVGLVLVDLIMPGFNEFDGLKLLRSKFPNIPFVVVSIHEDPDYVLRAIGHGVIGYIPKSASAEEIKTSLARIVSGEVDFPRHILTKMTSSPETGASSATTQSQSNDLTIREREVLSCLGRGLALADISEKLGISRQTVRVHLGNAMKKLKLGTREAAIRYAVENLSQLQSGN